MSYKSLIENRVRLAFNLVKDLAENVVFTRKTNSSFDFSSGQAVSTAKTSTIKVVVTENKKAYKDRNTVRKTVMAKTVDVGDMTLYESVTIKSLVWSVGKISKNDGYVTVFEAYREV